MDVPASKAERFRILERIKLTYERPFFLFRTLTISFKTVSELRSCYTKKLQSNHFCLSYHFILINFQLQLEI